MEQEGEETNLDKASEEENDTCCVADAVAGEPAKDFSRSSSAAPSNPTSHGSGVQRPPATRSGEEERAEGEWRLPSDPGPKQGGRPR